MRIFLGLFPLFLFTLACAPYKASRQSVLLASSFVQECGTMSDTACRTLYWVNHQRIIHWLEPLGTNPECVAGAEFHAQDMNQFRYFSHDGRNETWDQRYQRFGVPGGFAENIAQGGSPQQIVEMWMNSPEHRANILDPGLRSAGMGVSGNVYVNCFSTVEE